MECDDTTVTRQLPRTLIQASCRWIADYRPAREIDLRTPVGSVGGKRPCAAISDAMRAKPYSVDCDVYRRLRSGKLLVWLQ
jgi:hypothetical protein